MTRLEWKSDRFVSVAGCRIPCSERMSDEGIWKAGVRRDSERSQRFKSFVWPLVKLRDDLFVDGFIEWVVGRWIRAAMRDDTTFLEIGCGDMSLSRYVPDSVCYNAIDLSLSEFHLGRLLRRRPDANVAVASVTNIPVDSNTVSVAVSTQVLEYVQQVDHALKEIRRVAKSGATFICTIGNDFSRKYYSRRARKHTPHGGHVNLWTYEGFVELMTAYDFRLVEGQMRGVWVPFRWRLAHTSYALPIQARREADNTHFLYLFEVEK